MVKCGTTLFSSLLPYVHVLASSTTTTHCSQCFHVSSNLKRCSQCHLISYCSIKCQRLDWIYHKCECTYLHMINDEFDLTRLFIRLIIRSKNDDDDDDRIENKNDQRCLNDLVTHANEIRQDKRRYRTFELLFERLKNWNILKSIDESSLFLLFCRLVINTLTIHDGLDLKSLGYGLYLQATQFNHSCSPTSHTVFDGIYLSIRTLVDTSSEWTINYIDLLEPRSIRQESLRENYYFQCQCSRCTTGEDGKELLLLTKIRSEEQQMDRWIVEQDFFQAYQSSQSLSSLYEQILPYYHAYISLHHVKHLKLVLLLAEKLSNVLVNSTIVHTCDRVKISMGDDHPLTRETRRLCDEYKLEMTFQQNQIM